MSRVDKYTSTSKPITNASVELLYYLFENRSVWLIIKIIVRIAVL